jgi:methylenetetrahydrofolate reductase (NADPH)
MTHRISFEFFPPKSDEGLAKALRVRDKLAERKPEFFSVTFGAGGSTRDRTWSTVQEVRNGGIDTAPHLSCIGQSREEIAELVNAYKAQGVTRIVALRGDIPSGMGGQQSEVKYADDLVRVIREETGDHFTLEVAAYPEKHPQARSFEDDLDHFKRKIDAGANHGITQYFYNAEAYAFYMEQMDKRGVTAPVYPGIMPIINYANLKRFSDNCGADIPRWMRMKMEELQDDPDSLKDFGTEVVTRLCERLLALGAPGLHFYTMNQSKPTLRILDNLNL